MSAKKRKEQEDEQLKLVQTLALLPTPDKFAADLGKAKTEAEQRQILLPFLQQLHQVIHELLPKPNMGLWEPELKLDPFLLSYFTVMDFNVQYQHQRELQRELQRQQRKQQPNEAQNEAESNTSNTNNDKATAAQPIQSKL